MSESIYDSRAPWLWIRSAIAVCSVVLVAACGGGNDGADTSAAAIAAPDTEAMAAAEQLASGHREAALAVTTARATQNRLADPKRVRQVIVFGDSLSDVGTYRVGPVAEAGGGKFTTNPGPVWPETIGLLFGTRVTPYLTGGFGVDPRVNGGTGFAMGGSRVSKVPGYNCNPDGTGKCTAQLAIPISQQIDSYLEANGGQFKRDQLVFVLAGPNDIFFHLDLVAAAKESPQAALAEVQQAAIDLSAQVTRIASSGAKRIVLLNVPPMADTPFGKFLGSSPQTQPLLQLLTGMVDLFNGTLAQALNGSGVAQMPGVTLAQLDLHQEFTNILSNPGAYHVREINVPACDAAKIAAITQGVVTNGSSLFCSQRTLVQSLASVTYMFADSVHPSTLTHLLFARFIVIELWKRGLI
jgi:phospholipase/lecithinase/hemolysin